MRNVKMTIWVMAVVTILATTVSYADIITFNDGGSHEFNSYTTDTLAVEDSSGGNPTTLSLVSGTYVDNHYVYAYDFSELNVVAGYAYGIFPMDSSTANMSGGEAAYWHSYGISQTYIWGGDVSHRLNSHESSVVNVTGGYISSLVAFDSSVVALSGGIIANLSSYDSSIINIHGSNFFVSDTGGSQGDGYITGNWLDSTPFNISIFNDPVFGEDTISHINLVPAPGALLLGSLGLTFSGWILKRKGMM
ncbi:MAG: hypothetical protein FVQ84_17175 [Planctomycetes bacterium]|nr:hypothetical protein [Planctomycetota bacterium]